MSGLMNMIKRYYDERKIKEPSFDESMKFVQTELAEVYELDLARIGGWTRNNPETKPKYTRESMGEEIGDAIMMLMKAGQAEDVDPIECLIAKLSRKAGWKI